MYIYDNTAWSVAGLRDQLQPASILITYHQLCNFAYVEQDPIGHLLNIY